MLIVPTEKLVDWKNPPVITLALVIINCLILFLAPADTLRHNRWVMEFGFIPVQHKPITFISHAFLHGDFEHLFGNMLFLFLIGFAVENVLGRWLYLTFYLLSGLAAVLLFWALNFDSDIPLVGASGCIAGLMGLYAGLFGMRKIRFFYSVIFYFGYATAPALILLPIWLFKEYYQLRWGEDDHVAYTAHMGGLIGGGLLGVVIKKFQGKVDTAYLNESQRLESRNNRYEQGILALKGLQIEKALAIFQGLTQENPEDLEALAQYCKVLKLKPNHPDYPRMTNKLLCLPPTAKISFREIHDMFLDYRKSKYDPLSPELLVELGKRCCREGYEETALLIAKDFWVHPPVDNAAAELFLFLVTYFKRKGDFSKEKQYLSLLQQLFPHHRATLQAQNL